MASKHFYMRDKEVGGGWKKIIPNETKKCYFLPGVMLMFHSRVCKSILTNKQQVCLNERVISSNVLTCEKKVIFSQASWKDGLKRTIRQS